MICPQLTSTDQSALAISYLAIGWLSAAYLVIGWLSAGYWLAISYVLAIYGLTMD